jgi:hypothetical protein
MKVARGGSNISRWTLKSTSLATPQDSQSLAIVFFRACYWYVEFSSFVPCSTPVEFSSFISTNAGSTIVAWTKSLPFRKKKARRKKKTVPRRCSRWQRHFKVDSKEHEPRHSQSLATVPSLLLYR